MEMAGRLADPGVGTLPAAVLLENCAPGQPEQGRQSVHGTEVRCGCQFFEKAMSWTGV